MSTNDCIGVLLGHFIYSTGDVEEQFEIFNAEHLELWLFPECGLVLNNETDAILFELLCRVQMGED